MAKKFEFRGKIVKSDLDIEANEDVQIIVEGKSMISGRVKAPGFKVEFQVNGTSIVKFEGECQKLEIKSISDKSILDLSELQSPEASIEWASDRCIISLGVNEHLHKAYLEKKCILYLINNPEIENLTLADNSMIQYSRHSIL